MYGAHVYRYGDQTELTIFSLSDENQRDILQIGVEVYRTQFWCLTPLKFAEEILDAFGEVTRKEHPIELVYQYGGTISGSPVRLFPKSIGVH